MPRDAPRGRYFDDFTKGEVLLTGRRTITSTDIVNFACLSGDFNEVHCNHEYCKTLPFGEPIAHGPLVYAVAAGLNYASGLHDGTLIGLVGIDRWRMHEPVKHGDTIECRSTVLDLQPTSKPGRGVVVFRREIVNQRGQVVQSLEATLMFRTRPQQAG
jgi:acyl dehydratase